MNLPMLISKLFTALIVAVFALLLVLETARPLRRPKRARATLSDQLLLNRPGVCRRDLNRPARGPGFGVSAQAHSLGLSHLLLPRLPWAQAVVGILWMDLTFYYWHRFNHLRPLLWRFHNVHHVDPDLDVTTSFRFHFGEILYSTPFRLLQVGLLGVSPATYLLYEFLFNCATLFEHSNVRLPLALERLLK